MQVKTVQYLVAVCCMLIQLVCAGKADAQLADSTYIRAFAKKNVIELNIGRDQSGFAFSSPDETFHERRNDERMKVNNGIYVGAYLQYKFLSLSYSFIVPGTLTDPAAKFHYTSLRFQVSNKHLIAEPFYHQYNGLLLSHRHTRQYITLKNLTEKDAGMDLFLLQNTSRFSFAASDFFSARQLKSQGACFAVLSPLWQRMTSNTSANEIIKDSSVSNQLKEKPEWVSFTPKIGYAYAFSMHHGDWLITPAVLTGAGASKRLYAHGTQLHTATDFQAWINAGYNGDSFYCYLNSKWEYQQTGFLLQRTIRRESAGISLTAGYRFSNCKRKIAGLL
ncbi:MAG: DUF4421 domain-containing protein [Chitinophagaceae bacterium]|nr:DUF4421 domain-containing protein [Chitinophagaceae bacterium]